MEADWEVEIGGDAPVIEACWPGFVDLRAAPEPASELAETLELAGLADALRLLNSSGSEVWTSKTDVFVPEAIDPDELDSAEGSAAYALACYIDLLPRSEHAWMSSAGALLAGQEICARLREIGLRCCRVDLVIRRAFVAQDETAHGITVYCTACGVTAEAAKARLGECVAVFADAIA